MRLPARCSPPALRYAGVGGSDVGVVAVPGLGLSVEAWRGSLTLLCPGGGAVGVALPAFGEPAAPDAALDPVASAERLSARLDALGLGRVMLMGHSASCQVVAELAAQAPERVSGLVLVGPTTDPRATTWPRLAGRWVLTARREPAGQVPLLVRDYTYSGLVSFARTLDAARHHRIELTLARVRCPVLLVRGADDRIAPASWLDRLAGGPGDIRMVTTTGAHMLPLTHARELTEQVRPFLAATACERAGQGRRAAG